MLGPFWWCTSPLHYHGKAPQPSYLPETTSLKKKHPFSPKFVECMNLRIPMHLLRKSRPFSTLPTLVSHSSIIIECKRQGVYFGVENKPIFTQNYHKTLTFFRVIVPNAATSTQQSIKEEGEIKVICGEWFFCCCQLLTATIGQQRKEESDFLTGKEDHGAWMELLWTTLQSTSKLPVEWLSVRSLLACIFLVFFRFCQLSVTLLHPFILCSLSLGNLPWPYIGT